MSEKKVWKRISKVAENVIESFLWNFRLIIFLGVIGLIVCSTIVFVMGILETYNVVVQLVSHIFNHGLHFHEIYNSIIVGVITIVDDFLLGIVLLIFSLGTYDLFISRIDPAEEQDDIRPDWLVFNSLDELKSVLGKVVLMIMIINFLKYTVDTPLETPLQLLYLGGGIALIALSMKWSHGEDINHSTIADRMKARAGLKKENSDH